MEHTLTDKELARKKRGQTTTDNDKRFAQFSNTGLMNLITDPDSQKRTSAAKILGERKCIEAITPLCSQLRIETVLYPKIAISDALGNIGEAALPALIPLIGKIGDNQHVVLPTDIFKKWNYPLPRDIAVRTIIKSGLHALKYLKDILRSKEISIIAETIDAIGYISFYSKDYSSLPLLINLLNSTDNDIIKWKILRSFSAFPLYESEEILRGYLIKNSVPALRWEAARSLALTGNKQCMTILKKARDKEDHDLVIKMIDLSIFKLKRDDHSTKNRPQKAPRFNYRINVKRKGKIWKILQRHN